MHRPVLQLLPHTDEKDFDLLGRPVQRLGKQPRYHPTQSIQQVLHFEGTDELEALVLRPGVHGQLVDDFGHFLKAALLEPTTPTGRVVDGRSEGRGTLVDGFAELTQHAVGRERGIVTLDYACHTLELNPAAGF